MRDSYISIVMKNMTSIKLIVNFLAFPFSAYKMLYAIYKQINS
jgi:hypothetical protein